MAAGGHLGLLKKHKKSSIPFFVIINQIDYGYNYLKFKSGVKLKSQAQNLGNFQNPRWPPAAILKMLNISYSAHFKS